MMREAFLWNELDLNRLVFPVFKSGIKLDLNELFVVSLFRSGASCLLPWIFDPFYIFLRPPAALSTSALCSTYSPPPPSSSTPVPCRHTDRLFPSLILKIMANASLRWGIFALLTMVTAVTADPMILLMNAQAKCMSVEAPADAILNIEYEAPDLVIPPEKEENGEPADPRTYRRFRTTITASQDEGRANHHGRNPDTQGQHGRKQKEQRHQVVKDLDAKKGNIQFTTIRDGKVSICVQSLTASAISPTPISLRVTESPAGEESLSPPKEEETPGLKVDNQSQRKAKEHFSQMEKTLTSLISKTEMILRQADFAKELEVEFHEQSIAMNKASQWWPIVQLCVLLVTGFTQANHMVQFFRKHHIF